MSPTLSKCSVLGVCYITRTQRLRPSTTFRCLFELSATAPRRPAGRSFRTLLKKEKNLSGIPLGPDMSEARLEIISTPTLDTPGTAVSLSIGSHKYLFGNGSSGLQRAIAERGMRVSRVKEIFMTGTMSVTNTSGLYGLILSASEARDILREELGEKEVQRKPETFGVHGGSGLKAFIHSTAKFTEKRRDYAPYKVHEYKPPIPNGDSLADPIWNDESVTVSAIQTFPTSIDRIESQDVLSPQSPLKRSFESMSGETYVSPGKNASDEAITHNSNTSSTDNDTPPDPLYASMSYIVKLKPARGKFFPEKAIALGVKPGTMFSELTKGNSLTLENGVVVKPEDVMGPLPPPLFFGVIDIPSNDYVERLARRPEWSKPEFTSNLKTIFWILGPSVIHNHFLRSIIDSLPKVDHIVSSVNTCPNNLVFHGPARTLIHYSLMDPERNIIPIHSNVCEVGDCRTDNSKVQGVQNALLPWRAAESGLRIPLLPNYRIDETECVPFLNTATIIDEWNPPADKTNELRQRSANEQYDDPRLPSPEAEVIPLGTGSACPSPHRNVSATLLKMPNNSSYLFDCGEGTLGQIRRMPNMEKTIEQLRLIWISHSHADHLLGLLELLKIRTNLDASRPSGIDDAPRLAIVADVTILSWIVNAAEIQDLSIETLDLYAMSTNGRFLEDPLGHTQFYKYGTDYTSLLLSKDEKSEFLAGLGLLNFAINQNAHCASAKCVALTFQTGFKFSYSGDSRPSLDFAVIGKNSTVLVHEATLEDDLRLDALAKRHSTISEAIAVGAKMGAKNLVLTHMSQRYGKYPVFNSADIKSVDMESHWSPPPLDSFTSGSERRSLTYVRWARKHSVEINPEAIKTMPTIFAHDMMVLKVKDMAYVAEIMPKMVSIRYAEDVKAQKRLLDSSGGSHKKFEVLLKEKRKHSESLKKREKMMG